MLKIKVRWKVKYENERNNKILKKKCKNEILKINVKMNKKLNVESKYIKMGDDVLNYELCNFDLKVDLKFK